MSEVGCEFITAIAYKGDEAIRGHTDRCKNVDFRSVGAILNKLGLMGEQVDKVIVFELKGEDIKRIGVYIM